MVRLSNLAAAPIALALLSSAAVAAEPELGTVKVNNTNFSRPVWVGSPPGDSTRLFVCEQNNERIRILDLTTGVTNPVDYLNLAAKVQSAGNEQGLLGMAFDPDYANNRYVYVHYTAIAGGQDSVVERYTTLANNPDRADPNSGVIMLGPINQPQSNHNAGDLDFGPDGYLYVGMGDGGGAGDSACNAQKENTLLGKMLRLDVSTVPASAPPTNPYVGNPAIDDRIWAFGLRNPWRYGFDQATGDLYIADVGQNAREEVNWVPASSTGGENYGWKVMEGNNCFSTSSCPVGTPTCNSPVFTDPVLDYSHAFGCSITGGEVYRGSEIPGLQGVYFYADYCSARIWSFRIVNGAVTEAQERTTEIKPAGININQITTFGYDDNNEMYIVEQSGEIWKVVAEGLAGVGLGFGKAGGNGKVPCLTATGSLAAGAVATVSLSDAAPNRLAILFGSVASNPSPTIAGTLLPVPPQISLALFTDGNGEINIPANGGGGPLTFNIQYAIDDPGAVLGAASSNAFALDVGP